MRSEFPQVRKDCPRREEEIGVQLLAGVLGVPRRAGLGSATLIRFGRRAAPGEPLTRKKQEEETKEKKKKDAGQGRWGGADSQRLGCEEIDEE